MTPTEEKRAELERRLCTSTQAGRIHWTREIIGRYRWETDSGASVTLVSNDIGTCKVTLRGDDGMIDSEWATNARLFEVVRDQCDERAAKMIDGIIASLDEMLAVPPEPRDPGKPPSPPANPSNVDDERWFWGDGPRTFGRVLWPWAHRP